VLGGTPSVPCPRGMDLTAWFGPQGAFSSGEAANIFGSGPVPPPAALSPPPPYTPPLQLRGLRPPIRHPFHWKSVLSTPQNATAHVQQLADRSRASSWPPGGSTRGQIPVSPSYRALDCPAGSSRLSGGGLVKGGKFISICLNCGRAGGGGGGSSPLFTL
jgi:hypothetical protein